MIYMGSKARIAKDILPIMLKDIGDRYFVDLFCGGGNLVQFVNCKNIIANDINPYTIAFLKRIKEEGCDWLPKNNQEFTKQHYQYVKNNKNKFKKSVLGHVGYNLSFGGKFFGGWCRNANRKDYVKAGYEHALRQYDLIRDKNIIFENKSYNEVTIPNNSVIYCDIPYRDTTKYKNQIDYDKFYNWCRGLKMGGNMVYISEYNMPDDFKCIWQKEVKMKLDVKTNSKIAIEKLFTI